MFVLEISPSPQSVLDTQEQEEVSNYEQKTFLKTV